jgi:RecJ-like exonuclease
MAVKRLTAAEKPDQKKALKVAVKTKHLPPNWAKNFRRAQKEQVYVINGKSYPRIRYGEETDEWAAGDYPCGDCCVAPGQFHVPGCDLEQCPVCGGQALSCACNECGLHHRWLEAVQAGCTKAKKTVAKKAVKTKKRAR